MSEQLPLTVDGRLKSPRQPERSSLERVTFHRQTAESWRREVPGARWLKADLHVHTIDDHPGRRAKWPAGMSGGDPTDPADLERYSRAFLREVVRAGIQVVGLTPHCPRAGEGPETSAVWHIVDTWNQADDDDGKPFREKIFAVFPGFEPSLKQGQDGLHLLFLFDPETGRDKYLRSFDAVMGAIRPWRDGTLRIATGDLAKAAKKLSEFMELECEPNETGERPWNVLVLAPHPFGPKGVFTAMKSQVLQYFEHHWLTALELPENKLPEDVINEKPAWFEVGLKQHGHTFYHASDAYKPGEIGRRYTWMKLASPRIESLRQAFIASDSRIRIAYERTKDGQLKELAGPPDPQVSGRPWLRRLELEGGASFFGGHVDGRPIRATFDFSPDLTCIIGGSMTGKSTLLDGLRCYTEAGLPRDKRLAENVRVRGEDIFLAGQPTISLDVSAPDHVAPLAERWPARFFTQNELQRLVEEPEALEDILCRLVPEQTESIEGSRRRLRDLDARLSQKATRLTHLDQQIEEAEQQKRRAEQALAALKAIEEAGYEDLQLAAREASRVAAAAADAGELQSTVQNVEEQVGGLAHGVDPQRLALLWSEVENRDGRPNLEEQAKGLKDVAGTLTRRASEYQESLRLLADSANRNSQRLREKVEGALAAQGYGASKLAEFRALADRAKLVDSYRSALDHANKEQSAAKEAFELGVIERESVEERLRAAFDEVLKRIETEFPERIRARRLKNAGAKSLESFLLALAAKGVTRWWNSLDLENRHSPKELLDALEQQRLDEIGMSDRVRESFRELMTRARQRELAALRSTDLYDLELRLEDGSWRRLAELSGGRQVSVLLSLLLETHDERPLVIDQPEDELDNRFLFKTVLPALRRIKGQRQIIVATHNANIVVNGDADQVILLEASANAGRVAAFGTIEEPSVRDAIVATVDGGGDAFRLRQLKYGF